MVTGLSPWGPLAVLAGAVCGAGTLLLAVAIRGLPAGSGPGAAARRRLRELAGRRGAAALAAGAVALVATRWLAAGVGVALLVFAWRGLSGAAGSARPWPAWRRWPPGPSRCATRSPARSAWNRRSRPRCGWRPR
jgi:hypothetical protein